MVTSKIVKGTKCSILYSRVQEEIFALGNPLHTRETLLKYIGGLHSYLRHTILIFNPSNIDEVLVQATHMEASKSKPGLEGMSKKTPRFKKHSKGKKEKGQKETTVNKRTKESTCTHF